MANSGVRGASVSDIRAAISANRGGMGSLSGLTTEELQAISQVLAGGSTSSRTSGSEDDHSYTGGDDDHSYTDGDDDHSNARNEHSRRWYRRDLRTSERDD